MLITLASGSRVAGPGPRSSIAWDPLSGYKVDLALGDPPLLTAGRLSVRKNFPAYIPSELHLPIPLGLIIPWQLPSACHIWPGYCLV